MEKLETFLINLSLVIMAPFTLVRFILFVIEHLVQLISVIVITPVLLLLVSLDSRVGWSDVTDVYKNIWRHLLDIEGVFLI